MYVMCWECPLISLLKDGAALLLYCWHAGHTSDYFSSSTDQKYHQTTKSRMMTIQVVVVVPPPPRKKNDEPEMVPWLAGTAFAEGKQRLRSQVVTLLCSGASVVVVGMNFNQC